MRRRPYRLSVAATLILASCSAAPNEDPRRAAEPAAIASALCGEQHPDAIAACQARLPADLASQTAYSNCLDYNRRDLGPCNKLRAAYEADLRAYLEPSPPPMRGQRAKLAAPRVLASSELRGLHQVAEDLYKASSRDSQTFEAALLILEVRQKIEAALGQKLSASALQALIAKTRAEALYWYEYMQGLERRDRASVR